MKSYKLLVVFLILALSGCRSIDLNTIPIRIDYSALKTKYYKPNEQERYYEYPKYSIVQKYAENVNSKIRADSPILKLMLAANDFPLYSTVPEYEIRGTGLVVHLGSTIGRLNEEELTLIEPRIMGLLAPLADKLGGEVIKLKSNPNQKPSPNGFQP